jgi:outer membrane protein assembly factor BamD (BamD/ComL family)
MVEAYAQMGMRELAQVSMDTLAKNFSRDPFTTRSASVMAGKPVKSMKKMIENL